MKRVFSNYSESEFFEAVKYCDGVEFYHLQNEDGNICTDNLMSLAGKGDDVSFYLDSNKEVRCEIKEMDEEDYNRYVVGNAGVSFDEVYDKDDRVAVVIIPQTIYTVRVVIDQPNDQVKEVDGAEFWTEAAARRYYDDKCEHLSEICNEQKAAALVTIYVGDGFDPCATILDNHSESFVGECLTGKIIITWSWHQYIGYARKFIKAEMAGEDMYECDLIPDRDETFVPQQSVLDNAEDIYDSAWKWTNPQFAADSVEEWMNHVVVKNYRNVPVDVVSDWLRQIADDGCGVYVVCNGGGLSLISSEDIDALIEDINSGDYEKDCDWIDKGEEYTDFKSGMRPRDYEYTEYFIRVNHKTGYNQENNDYQIQYWTV